MAAQATTELTPRAIGARIEREPGASGVDAPLPTSRSQKQGGGAARGQHVRRRRRPGWGRVGTSSAACPQGASESPTGGRGPLRSPCLSLSLGSRLQEGSPESEPPARSLEISSYVNSGPQPISRARHVGCSARSSGRGGERCVLLFPLDLRNEAGNGRGSSRGRTHRRTCCWFSSCPATPSTWMLEVGSKALERGLSPPHVWL